MLTKLLSIFLVFLAAAMFTATPALAGDAASGAKIFSANCAACHAGGRNLISGAKTLQKEDLKQLVRYPTLHKQVHLLALYQLSTL